MKLPHLRSEQIKTQPDQTSALINKIIDRVNDPNLGGGGGGGTSDFNELTNRPSYAGTTMTGSTNIPAVPTKTSQLNNDSGFVNTTDLTNAISNHNTSGTAHSDIRNSITSLSNSVTAIQNVIPTAATANNKLTDKNYVDDSINSVTAYYITKNAAGDAFATKAELNSATVFYSGGVVRIPTRNDYCIVVADESQRDPITGEDPTTRYIYNNGWEFQYIVNKTALTADQLAALNSGVTAADVTKLSGIEAGAEVNVQADWTEADNTSDAYIKNKPTIGNATLTVTQNGTSVGTFTANATSDVTLALTDTLYNDFTGATNITAGAHGLVIAPAAGDQLKALYGDGTWKLAHMTIAAYGKTTYAEILAAYKANNIIYCRASSNSNPGTGNQLRMAFLAYVNNETTPTEFEFQYYRSVATHTDSQQGDQVYVYKINSAGTWSVTVREAYTKVKAGTNMTSSYSSGAITLNATDTTYSDFVGATPSIAGTSGLVPAPAAGDNTKFLSGDGTWKTASAGGTRTEFRWGSSPDHTMKDTTDTNTVTGQDVYDACELGQVIITSMNPKPVHDDEVVSYQYYQSTYRFVVTYKDYSDSKHDMREYVYESGSWSSNTITLQNELSNATTATDGTMSAADKTNLDNLVTDDYLHDKFIAKGGTLIEDNSDLEDTDFLDLGMYYCPRNANVATIINCPVANAFTMRVYSPNDNFVRDTMTGTWVYRVREITTIIGQKWIQYVYSGDTPGSFTFRDWNRILTTGDGSFADKVDIASENIDNYSGTLAAKVQSIYPAGYHRWYTTINGSTANITDKPTTINMGFVLEAFLERDYNSTDWAYKVVCYTSYDDNQNYVGYVRNNTSSITWQKLLHSGSTIPESMLLHTNYYDRLAAIGGTDIPSNADLNTITYLSIGMYACETNAKAASLSNCPTSSAFTMRVYLSHSTSPRDINNEQWVYLVREITDLQGRKWNQNASSGTTPGVFTYGTWKQVIDERRVLSATAVRDAGWSADKDKIPDMSFMAYWNGAYSGTTSNLKYFANNCVTYNNLLKGSSGSYWTKSVGVDGSGVSEVGKYIDFHNTNGSANSYDVRLQVNSAGQTVVTIPNKTGTMALTSDCNYTAGTYDLGGISLIGSTGGNTNKVIWTLPLNKGTSGVTLSSVKLSDASTGYYGFTIPGHVSFRPSAGTASNIAIKGGSIVFTTGTSGTTVTAYHQAIGSFSKIEVTFA